MPPVRGRLLLWRKGDFGYDAARRVYNLRISRQPAVIAGCRTVTEVAEAVRLAGETGLPVAVKSGGHSFEGLSVNDGGLVVDVSAMDAVEWLDADTVRVGPGCRLATLYAATFARGRLLPAGSCGGVGVAGLTLGGGYGLFSRKYGLTCDHLTEVEMVDGSGRVRSSREDPELLRACRGGGNGQFGVITALTFRTHPMPERLVSHRFRIGGLDAARACAVLRRWLEVAGALPPECFSAFVLNGSSLLILLTDFAGTAPSSALEALRGMTERHSVAKATATTEAVKNYYGRPDPLWFKNASGGFFSAFQDLGDAALPALEMVVSTPGMIWQVNTLGGKISDPEFADGSVFPHRNKPFLAELQAYPRRPADRPVLLARFAEIRNLFRAAGVRDHYANYPDLAHGDWERAYYGGNVDFLRRIKKRYDPENRIRHARSLAPS